TPDLAAESHPDADGDAPTETGGSPGSGGAGTGGGGAGGAPGTGGAADGGADDAAGDASEVGSPDIDKLVITEVAPWGSGASMYAADWFEVTNVGSAAVNMTGWTMDDISNDVALSVPILGVGSIAPGQSA